MTSLLLAALLCAPKSQWKKGDARGKPQKPNARRNKVPPKLREGAK